MRSRSQLVAIYVAAVALAACSVDAVTFTPTLGDGPRAEDCAVAGDEDGNALADCSDPACASAPACQPACGNGKVEAGEGCDDGNGVNGDGCDSNCMVTGCGNGIVVTGEACDDGNTTSGDGCDNNCTVTGCGNGVMTAGEACDDGNGTNGDGCETNCTLPRCGNGIPDSGEQCDDGNGTNGDGCETNCTLPRCGNGIKDLGEQCDDGNGTNGDGCEANCTLPVCGNGIVDFGEQCDDGNTNNGDGCDTNCRIVACTTNLVPTMTSPTSPSGLVSRSGAFDSSDEAWQAFDASTSSMWISAVFQTPAWIAYQWGDGPRTVTSYAITFVNGSLTSRAPRDWTFEGWNGLFWTVIDTRGAQISWLGFERRAYPVTSPSSYSMYRLNVSDDNDSTQGVVVISMGTLELMGCPP